MSDNSKNTLIEQEEEEDIEMLDDNISIDIKGILEKEKKDMSIKIDFVIDKTLIYYNNLKKLYKNYSDIDKSFEKLKLLDIDRKIEILWDYLIKNFKNNFEYIIENYSKIKKKNKRLNDNEKKIKTLKKQNKDLKNNITTKERVYKHNYSKYNEMIYEINILKEFLIFLIVLLVIPILRLANIINKTLGIVSYMLLLFLGISYYIYLFFDNKNRRDNVFFNHFNFKKPDPDDVDKYEMQEEQQ